MAADHSPPAFPRPSFGPNEPSDGMSLRDWFAGQAMASALSTSTARSEEHLSDLFITVARLAYQAADAMLVERAKP